MLTTSWLKLIGQKHVSDPIGAANVGVCVAYCLSLTRPCACLPVYLPASPPLPPVLLIPPLRASGGAGQQMAGPYPSARDEWRMMSSQV